MKEKEKSKNKHVLFVAIALILTAVIGATFAYFTAQIGKGANVDINANTDTVDSLMFENTGDLTIEANQGNFGDDDGSIKKAAQVKATLTPNNTNNTAERKYNIYLIIEHNDLVYTSSDNKPELLIKLIDPETKEEYISTTTELLHYTNIKDRLYNEEGEDKVTYSGYDITNKDNFVYKLVENYPIKAEGSPKEHTWDIELVLVNYDYDQNKNTNKTFKGKIYITNVDEKVEVKTIDTIDTTVAVGDSPSITAVANISSEENIDKYYFAIEETDETPATATISSISALASKSYESEDTNTHTFSEDIIADQNYKIYTYAVDKKGIQSNYYETVVTAKEGEIPKITGLTHTETITSISITDVTLEQPKEGLQYRYKLDNGSWSEWSTSAEKEFSDLNPSTKYKIYVQVMDNDLISNIKIETVKTKLAYTVSVDVINGTSTPEKSVVAEGDTATFEIQAIDGYNIKKAKATPEDKCEITEDGTLTVADVTSNVNCKVEIPIIDFHLVCDETTLACKVAKQYKNNVVDDNGGVYYHDETLEGGAEDNSYRYAGNNPNNFVCLEEFQENGGCDDVNNLYRIIGVFPFKDNIQQTSYSKEMEYRVKLIKSEYITKEELGTGSYEYGDRSNEISPIKSYEYQSRVKNTIGINGFYWNTVQYGSWKKPNSDKYNLWEYKENEGDNKVATLNKALNDAENGYLGTISEDWISKIVSTTWHIAGGSYWETVNNTSYNVFQVEMNNQIITGYQSAPQTTSTAQIGLMYVSDYGYAAANVNNLWTKMLGYGGYDIDDNRQHNWLYNGVYEWTITRASDDSYNARGIGSTGNVVNSDVYSNSFGIRPVFYLDSIIKLKSDESTDGSQANPYIVTPLT